MVQTQIDLDGEENWIVRRFMADEKKGAKSKAIKAIIREFGKHKKYKRD